MEADLFLNFHKIKVIVTAAIVAAYSPELCTLSRDFRFPSFFNFKTSQISRPIFAEILKRGKVKTFQSAADVPFHS